MEIPKTLTRFNALSHFYGCCIIKRFTFRMANDLLIGHLKQMIPLLLVLLASHKIGRKQNRIGCSVCSVGWHRVRYGKREVRTCPEEQKGFRRMMHAPCSSLSKACSLSLGRNPKSLHCIKRQLTRGKGRKLAMTQSEFLWRWTWMHL